MSIPIYDILVIGGGIVGCSAVYELSKYNVGVALLEAENDIACGTTRANSAIVHAGYDPPTGSLMARCNVRGAKLIHDLCGKLDVPYRRNGALVLAFDEQDVAALQKLYTRGLENGVEELSILTREQTLALEPALSPQIMGALHAKSSAIVSPWELALALAQTAVVNGAEVLLNRRVASITTAGGLFRVSTSSGVVFSRYIVNAAGLYADKIHEMAGGSGFSIKPNKGQYFLLDKNQGQLVDHTIFQCPTARGKGVLVSPVVHGNLIVGPDSLPTDDRDDVSTTAQELQSIAETARKSVPSINFRENIRNFAGLRSYADREDFIIEASAQIPRFINLAGMKSPGLTAAPAAAELAVSLLADMGMLLEPKPFFHDERRCVRFKEASAEEKSRLIAQNPLYGRVICRCETITEGEILDALHAPIPPVSLDAVKRRCGAGLGRCQGGFCGPRIHEILAREQKRPFESVELDTAGSYIATGETKAGGGI